MQALGRPIPATRSAAGGAGAGCRRAAAPCLSSRVRAAANAADEAPAATAADLPAATTAGRLVDARLRAEGAFRAYYAEIELDTCSSGIDGVSLHDLTPLVRRAVRDSGVADGTAAVTSLHTTVAVSVNEDEPRLADDVRLWLGRLAPAAGPWRHNDLHLRRAPGGWPGGDEAWRAHEPENAQAHLQAMLLGASSGPLAVCDGQLKIGRWQSVLGVELDGPRTRRFGVGVTGLRGSAAAPP